MPEVKPNSGFKAKKLKDIIGFRTVPMNMGSKWREFLGNMPKNAQWTMLVFGPSFGGKSTFAMKFCPQLVQNGKVLYVNAEESSEGGTLQEKLRRLKVSPDKIYIQDSCKIDDLKTEFGSGGYKYVIFDSISKFAKFNHITVLEAYELHRDYPDISFIYILFTTKDGKHYKGESDRVFLSEVCVEVRNLVADCSLKNRYKTNRSHFTFEFINN